MTSISSREDVNIVVVGHVDHGKSTVIGRLLADTGTLPDGKLEYIKELCRKTARPFEYAFLLDAFKEEQSQGITIDSARCFFRTAKRNYTIIDAPGHIEFLKNMITGAARAEAAILVIDALEGIQENSRRHGFMLSMLGIKQIIVLINKMDLLNYSQDAFWDIQQEYLSFLNMIKLKPQFFIPASASQGDNIVSCSKNMSWYEGPSVLEALDKFSSEKLPENKPFRMPVQDVYKFTANGDTRRIIAGTIESGRITVGNEVIFYPSGKKSTVKTIEKFPEENIETVTVGYATGFTLTDHIYISRGEVATLVNEVQPQVGTKFRANVFWLGKEPLKKEKHYFIKLGTAKVQATLQKIIRVINAASLEERRQDFLNPYNVAECIFSLDRNIAFDTPDIVLQTSRFVIIDDYEIAGGGIIQEVLEDELSWVRKKVQLRNYKWERSHISEEYRAQRYNQKAKLILITGTPDIDRKAMAKRLEKDLFEQGQFVYFLGMSNLLYGIDADLNKLNEHQQEEHFRRLAELANIMLDAGIILIVSAREITKYDLNILNLAIRSEKIRVIWLGKNVTTNIPVDLHIEEVKSEWIVSDKIRTLMNKEGIISS